MRVQDLAKTLLCQRLANMIKSNGRESRARGDRGTCCALELLWGLKKQLLGLRHASSGSNGISKRARTVSPRPNRLAAVAVASSPCLGGEVKLSRLGMDIGWKSHYQPGASESGKPTLQ